MKNYDIKINGKSFNVGIESVSAGTSAKVIVNGKEYFVQIDGDKSSPAVPVSSPAPVSSSPVKTCEEAPAAGENVITSPLPGVVIGISVSVGDKVKPGQCLATLEAMKMENAIEADCAGTVKKIFVQKGDSILEGAKIIMIG